MKERNRLFAILLAVMMVFTYMPSMAFAAAEDGSAEEPAAVTDVQEEAVEETAQNEQGEAEVQEEEPEAQVEEAAESEAAEPEAEPVNDAEEPEKTHGKLVAAKPVKVVPKAKIADNDKLFEDYFDSQVDSALKEAAKADPSKRTYTAKNAKRNTKLNAIEKYIYGEILKEFQKAASGQTQSTEFTIDLSEKLKDYIVETDDAAYPYAITSESLGIQEGVYVLHEYDWMGLSDQAKAALFDLEKTVDAVLIDNPYEAYWFDKTAGYSFAFADSYDEDAESSDIYFSEGGPELWLGFNVAEAYRPENGDAYEIDADKAASTATAAEKVQQVVTQNANLGDLKKLTAYKDTICEMTDYNYEAANWENNVPYGDPWQLIYVFDDDDATKVVCEGYAKAYQYLCDKSTFDNQETECNTVTGNLDTGAGHENHMWNIIHMDDGRNYIADITNCDVDGQAEGPFPEYLFLKGYASGDIDAGYTYETEEGTAWYEYDESTRKNFGSDELEMSMADYGKELPVLDLEYRRAEQSVYENTGGWWHEADEGEETWYYYDIDPREGDVLVVDGTEYSYQYVEDGDEYVWGFYTSDNSDKLNMNRFSIQAKVDQYEEHWTLAEGEEEHAFPIVVSYMGNTVESTVTLVKNPVESISYTSALVLTENTNGDWNENTGNYWYYIGPEEGDVLTVDGVDYTYKCLNFGDDDFWVYINDDGKEISRNDVWFGENQGENPWIIPDGETETSVSFTVEYMGKTCDAEAKLVKNPITGISFVPVNEYTDRIENVDGWLNDDGSFSYDGPEFVDGDKLTVSYRDKGDVAYVYDDEKYRFIASEGNADPISKYEVAYSYTDDFSEFTVNGEYETTVEYMGSATSGSIVRIIPNPVASISFSRDGESKIELIQGKDSDDRYDWEADAYFEEYYLSFEYGDKLTVKYTDNKSAVYEFREVEFDRWTEDLFVNVEDETDTIGNGDDVWIEADPAQGVDNQWVAGKTYNAAVHYMGREAKINVAVKPNPITKIVYKTYKGADTIKLAENVCGYWEEDEDGVVTDFCYSFPGFMEGDSLTITENGKTSTYVLDDAVDLYDSAFVNEEGKKISGEELDVYMSNQFEPDAWVKGGSGYYFETKYEGFKLKIPVEIVENPVKKVSFTRSGAGSDEAHPIELVEGLDGELNSDGGKNRYFEYYLTMQNGDVLRLNDTSDYKAVPRSEQDAEATYFENDEGERIRSNDIEQSSDQSFDNQWLAGDGVYKLALQYANQPTDVNIKIVENPVKNISFVRPGSDTVELIKEGDGSWDGYTFYYEPKFREGDKIVITYAGTSTPVTYAASVEADGNVYEFKATGAVPSNGQDTISVYGDLEYRHNSSYWLDDPETEADRYIMLMYNGKWADIPVSFVDNPVESIEYIWKAGGKEVEVEEGDYGIPFAEGDILKVKYAGTETPVSYVYGDENGVSAFRASGSVPAGAPKAISESEFHQYWDGDDDMWIAGNSFDLNLEYLGKTYAVPVKVVQGVPDINDCSVTFDQTYRKLEQIDSTPYDDYFYVVHKGTTLAPIVKKEDVVLDSKYYGARYTEVEFNKTANEWQIKDDTKWSATFPEEAGVYLCEVSGSDPYTGVYEGFLDLIRIEDHSWDNGTVTTAASCETDGVKTYKCAKCSETKEEVIKATGKHVWGKASYKWNSDYTEVTGSHKCSVCDKTETETAKRASVKVNKESTLTEKGEAVYTSEAFTVEGFEVQTITAETPKLPVEDALADAEKENNKASGDAADAEKAAQNSTNESDASAAEDSAAKAVELAAMAEEAATAAAADAQKALDNLPADASDEEKAIAKTNLDNANKNLAVAKKLKAAASSTLAKAKSAAAKIASNKAKAASEAAKNAKDSAEAEKLRKEAEQYAAKAAEKTAAAETASKAAETAVTDLEELAKTVDDPAVKEEVNKTASEAKESKKEAESAATAAETSKKEAETSETAAQGAVDDKKAAEEEAFKDHNGTPEITLSATDLTYKYKVKKVKKKKKAVATVQKPTVQSVKLNGKTVNAANYDVTWSNESSGAIGEYSVTVTLKGDYSGKASTTYRINPKAVKLKKVKAGKKRFTASWKKLGKNDIKYKAIGGYQLRYATDPEFTDEKIVSGGSLKKTSKTVKKLKKKMTYYVQLRTYKKVSGKYFYSGWSATKKVKIKK